MTAPQRLRPHPSLPSPWAEAVDPDRDSLADWQQEAKPPIVWSIAGTDSGGGAGLSADTRAAAALGVHLCPVVAAVTAQHSQGVQAVFALPREQIQAQLDALAGDMPPRVVKTGLLASVAAVQAVARCIDALRARHGFVALVVDPVLGASAGGAAFANAELVEAYRRELLPRATLVTPNRREAEALSGQAGEVPQLAAALQQQGAQAVCITGGDDATQAHQQDLALDWWDGPLSPWLPSLGGTRGWLALPRLRSPHHHGSGCTFASAAAAALARGFALADAAVLAKMLAWCALRDGHAAGRGAGPLRPTPAFIGDADAMPVMGFADEATPTTATLARWARMLRGRAPGARFASGLYALADSPQGIARLTDSGLFAQLQLRIKRDPLASGEDAARLRAAVRASIAAAGSSALWINDHWQLALDEGARAIHLGQEDWAALDAAQRERLLGADGPALGISSHSLWELARARGLAPSYIACGPVWPTTTKAMPWLPQGLAQLRWWAAMAGRPVVAIGGLLRPEQAAACARAGATAACLVRAAAPDSTPDDWAAFDAAWLRGQWDAPQRGQWIAPQRDQQLLRAPAS